MEKIILLLFLFGVLLTFTFSLNYTFAATNFVDSFDVSDEHSNPSGITFNTDGTKMFVIDAGPDTISEYPCATGFDVSTCNAAGVVSFNFAGQDNSGQGIAFNTDGTKMFVTGNVNDEIFEYPCATGFDVSTCNAAGVSSFDVSGEDNNVSGITFNTDGTKMFVVGYDNDNVYEYPCTTGFDVSTCNAAGVSSFDVSGEASVPTDVKFSSDGKTMFVVESAFVRLYVMEYPCTTGFDVSTCNAAGVDTFSVNNEETAPRGVAFNTDGTKMFVVGSNGDDVNEYTIDVGFDFDGVAPAAEEESEKNNSSDCYDCKPPILQSSRITISTNDYVVATGDDPIHITANVGDKVTVILNVTDNKSVQSIPFAALYTNYQEKPNDMNTFYANNFDKWKQISTSFYEWNIRADDVAYDYDGTMSWGVNAPTVVTDVTTTDNFIFQNNDNNVVEYFMMPFTFTINDFMEESAITAKIYDAAGNRLHVTLPVTLQTAGNDPINFDHMGKQKVLGFYDDEFLTQNLSDWNESESDVEVLSEILGLPEESLLPWTSNLAKWVAEGKIDSADLIVVVEYLINQ